MEPATIQAHHSHGVSVESRVARQVAVARARASSVRRTGTKSAPGPHPGSPGTGRGQGRPGWKKAELPSSLSSLLELTLNF